MYDVNVRYDNETVESYDKRHFLIDQFRLSTKSLISKSTFREDLKEIDFVCSGGGYAAFFAVGVWSILSKMGVRIIRTAGASAGSYSAINVAVNCDPFDWAMWYFEWRHQFLHSTLTRWEAVEKSYRNIVKPDFYKKLSDHLFISLSRIGLKCKNIIVSKYSDNEDLLSALQGTSHLPLVMSKKMLHYFRDQPVLDGGFLNNLPVFQDNQRMQCVVNLSRLNYPAKLRCQPLDDHYIELLKAGQKATLDALKGNADYSSPVLFLFPNSNVELFKRTYWEKLQSLHSLGTFLWLSEKGRNKVDPHFHQII